MAGPGTMTAAFANFGIFLGSPLQVWSAFNADTQTAVLALWRDRFEEPDLRFYHERRDTVPPPEWVKLRGNRTRFGHLNRVGIGGTFRVVMATAKSTEYNPRKGADWAARPDLLMEVTYIKPSGQFGAKVVKGAV